MPVEACEKANVVMGVKEFFGKTLRSTDEDVEDDLKREEELELRRKMEENRRVHAAKLEKQRLELASEKQNLASQGTNTLASNPDSAAKQPKSVLKVKEIKESKEEMDEKPDITKAKSVKFDTGVKQPEKKQPKKPKEEQKEAQPPERVSLFKQRMLGRE